MANDRKYQDLADCMRANAARFAAYKANYVRKTLDSILANEKLSPEQRKEHAAQAMSLFHHWGDAERNFAVQSAQMAQKWQDFAADGDEYLLQYRTAMDNKVREEHAILQGTTLPPSDPFWDKYYPPLGWNCRCTVVQVRRGKYQESDSAKACELGESCTANTPSFRFNPGKAKIAFPDGVSYFKHAGKTSEERLKTEKECQKIERNFLQIHAKEFVEQDLFAKCNINGTIQTVLVPDWGIKELAQSMYGDRNFWNKNDILNNITQLSSATYIRHASVDYEHNTGRTRRLKKKLKWFHYMNLTLSNDNMVVLNIAEHKDGRFYLYTITKHCPNF